MATIDISNRIIQTPTPSNDVHKLRWKPWRRAAQILSGILLVALPLTNGMRLDLRTWEFYFAWHKMAVHDLIMLFWISMLGVWILMTVSLLYGRVWCATVCPQTMASDFADSVKRRLDKAFRARPGMPVFIVSRGVWSLVLLVVSVGSGMIVTCYWFDPHAVSYATLHPAGDIAVASTIYGIAAFVAIDMLWIRRKFCSDTCPYGALISILADKNSLAARYLDERDSDCIRCGKCVVDCPMDIDIKEGVGQYSCIGCGMCVDACNDVLGPRGKAGLIEFRYGLEPEHVTKSLPLLQRLGLWDLKRYAALATLIASIAVIFTTIYWKTPVYTYVIANGAITQDASNVQNGYTLKIENGLPEAQSYRVSISGLSSGSILVPAGSIVVQSHELKSLPLIITSPKSALHPGHRSDIKLTVESTLDHHVLPLVFFTPQSP
jgi:polyferredoxin